MERIMKILSTVLMSLSIVGCSMPHSPVTLDENTNFKGIKNIDGSNESKTTVVMIHGMCEKRYDWALKQSNQFAKYVGNRDSPQINDLLYYYPKGVNVQGSPALRSYDYGDLTVYSYHYSDWNTIRKDLENDNASAKANNKIKNKLVNGCLSDVTTYAGDKGAEIRFKLLESLYLINGSLNQNNDDRIIIISSSLGSKVLADVLLLDSQMNIPKEPINNSNPAFIEDTLRKVDSYKANAKSLLQRADTIFMASNQLALLYPLQPTLRVSKNNSEKVRAEQEFADPLVYALDMVIGEKLALKTRGNKTKLTVVAFNDPNDLLSYPVPDEVLIPSDDASKNFTLYNINVSNDWTWFGLLVDPVKTHTGYLSNDDVIELISCGTDSC